MDRDPIKSTVRNQRRKQRLGANATCMLCGEPDLECLTPRSIIEDHHLVGRENDRELTVPVCLNCHARATESQMQNGVEFSTPLTFLDRLISWLRAIVAFLGNLRDAVERWLQQAEEFRRQLTAEVPGWDARLRASSS